MLSIEESRFPAVSRLLSLQLRLWPEHERFLSARLEGGDVSFAEEIAQLILRVTDQPEKVAEDYRWLCERLYEEELHFRRTGAYRLSKFEDAYREVYSNREFMARYMNGVLLSHLWWDNHARVIEYYARTFLQGNRQGYSHLEIGPGHGLLLYLAANHAACGSVTGWDVSQTSLDATREMLKRLGVRREVLLRERNLLDAAKGDEQFDSIVISEVLEHVEEPKRALEMLRHHLAPEGRLFVNVPINSPAPDHIYLFNTPEEGVALVRDAGYRVLDTRFFPMTGFTDKRARTMKATISCAVIGTIP